MLAIMEFWEPRVAALYDVTKQTSATGWKQTRPMNLSANFAKVTSASSAIAHSTKSKGLRTGPFRFPLQRRLVSMELSIQFDIVGLRIH
jgi:hypothetical protein